VAAPAPDIGQVREDVNSASWNTLGNTLAGTAGNGIVGPKNTGFGMELWTNGQRALLADTATVPNLVGGSSSNSVASGVVGATIAGGGNATNPNSLGNLGTYGFIGGGTSNTVLNDHGFVGGGVGNSVGFVRAAIVGGDGNNASQTDSFIGGGNSNQIENISLSYGTIAGGASNTVSAAEATVGGGRSNTASGTDSTIPGGLSNSASGVASFAAGQNASANFDGCFVWADDSAATTLPCGAVNKFVARAAGGTFFYSNAAATAGVKLTSGANAWAPVSDRNAKQDFVPVKPEQVLARVVAMPVSTWTYKSELGIRHMGPMAQDFRAAFGLGTDDKSIVTVDADGVALAAIQGLNQKVTKLEAENESLRRRLDRLEAARSPAMASMFPGGSLGVAGVALGIGIAVVLGRRKGPNERRS
jgi:hypothetical protein